MFTIKATYHGQIRKHTFTDTNHFPSYEQICSQLHRVFSIPQGFYLSKLLFSPDASQPPRILLGKEVHHAYDYHKAIRQHKDRTWPHGLLRFSVVDDVLSIAAGIHRVSTGAEFDVTLTNRSASSHVPMDVDPTTPTTSNIRSQYPRPPPQHPASAPSLGACCPVSQGRAQVQQLLFNFQEGLNRVLESNLESSLVITPAAVNAEALDGPTENSASAPPPSLCSVCTKNITSPLNGQWHSCASCHIVVCNGCYDKAKPGFCLSTMGPHNMKLATSASARASDLPIPRLPVPWAPLNSTSTSIREVRQPPASTSQREAPEDVIHLGIICDACGDTVKGIRHKCLDCPDYDLCTTCISGGAAAAHNPFHEFFDVNEPGKVIVHNIFSGNGEREAARGHSRRTSAPQPAAATEPIVHNATCDLCDSKIQGDRYKCLVCPDFDTCASCFRITDEQHPLHSFVRIQRLDDYIRPRPSPRLMHYATCDACNKHIYGDRFKCMHPDCPDYDLCDACEALPISVHPPNHPMLKMKTPDTVVPTVYRVGQRTMIPQTVPSTSARVEQNSNTDVSTSTLPDEDRVTTPTPIAPFPDFVFHVAQGDQAPLRVVSQGNPPPVPPKPEMISHPSWASIPGFFGPTTYPDVNPFSSSPSITNPFADIPSLPSVPPVGPVAESNAVKASEQVETIEKEITLPSVPKHTPSPWPTTNPAEQQELLQRIANFSGPTTSSELLSTLENLQTASRSWHDDLMSFGSPPPPPVPAMPQPPSAVAAAQQGPAKSACDAPTTDSNENVWSNVSGFSQSLLQRIELAEEIERDFARARSDVVLKNFFESLVSAKTDVAPNSTNNAEPATPPLTERLAREGSPAPPGSFPVPVNLLRDHLSSAGKPRASKAESVAESTISEEALLNRPSSEVASTVSTRLTLADLISELPSLVPTNAKGTPEPEEETRISLNAAFIEDVTVPDGQVFPPGAEFVKCWRLLNDGDDEWPESTELLFVAGEPLSAERAQSMTVELGNVAVGAEIDVWTGELKAPEVPGRYVGYWRLKANGELFGNSLWVDINVVESDIHHSSQESMASSSIIMPAPSVTSVRASAHEPSETAHSLTESAPASISSIDDSISEAGSDVSLISMPSSSDDEDEALWHDTRSQTTAELAAAAAARAAAGSLAASSHAPGSTVTAMDYVVLYDDNTSEGSE